MVLSAPKCNLRPVVVLTVVQLCCLYKWMICIVLELWGLREPVWKVNRPFMMNVANCYDWYLVDKLIHVEFPRLSVAGFQFWPWPVSVSVSCPGRHGVVWSGLGLGWMLLMNWATSPSVAALPRPTATWTWWLKSLLFSWYFSFCMSHVVGEVTYVELFKDAEGKSRVSDVGDSLQEVLKAPGSLFKKSSYWCWLIILGLSVTDLEVGCVTSLNVGYRWILLLKGWSLVDSGKLVLTYLTVKPLFCCGHFNWFQRLSVWLFSKGKCGVCDFGFSHWPWFLVSNSQITIVFCKCHNSRLTNFIFNTKITCLTLQL